ncbi:MAG: hypothetical protein RJA70_2637 [Pseudomonadota bacterium]|jgi:hypothetical protein
MLSAFRIVNFSPRAAALAIASTAAGASLSFGCTSEGGVAPASQHLHSDAGSLSEYQDAGDYADSSADTPPEAPSTTETTPTPVTTSPPPMTTGVSTSENPSPPPQGCNLEFAIETEEYPLNKYMGRHVGAIWITDQQGVSVRLLQGWGGARAAARLKRWTSTKGPTDVTSSATLLQHEAHHVTWDCTDANGEPVPFGTYVLHTQQSNISGPVAPYVGLSFEHSGVTPLEYTIGPRPGFKGGALKYEPKGGATTPPVPMCQDFFITTAGWCEMGSTCPGSIEQTSCWTDPDGQPWCGCGSASETPALRVSGARASEACAAARAECHAPSPLGPRECAAVASSESPESCSSERECWFPSTGGAISFAHATNTRLGCTRGADDWECRCTGPTASSSFNRSQASSPGAPCEETLDVCYEEITYEEQITCDPDSTSLSQADCSLYRTCSRHGVTTSGQVVSQSLDPYFVTCARMDNATTQWQCDCAGVASEQTGDGLDVCQQAMEGCMPQ